MEPEGSLPSAQEHATGPYPEQDESSPYHPNSVSLRSVLILSSFLLLNILSGLFPSGLLTFLFSPMHATCPFHNILLDLNNLYLARNISYEAPHYEILLVHL
jgi:hypothetical protein